MWKSLGYITIVAGTPQRITLNTPSLAWADNQAATKILICHAIFFQQVRTNTGFLLLGQSGLNESTGVALNGVLPVPTSNSLPNATVGIPDSSNPLNAVEYFVDGTVNGDKCLVSVLIL